MAAILVGGASFETGLVPEVDPKTVPESIAAGSPEAGDPIVDSVDGEQATSELRREVPNVCESFKVVVDAHGNTRHRRIRREWTDTDRKRFRDLVTMVAKEMGADPRLLRLWASRESTYNPYAVHVLNQDLEASSRAWRRHRYDEARVGELRSVMNRAGARSRTFWRAKAELARITRFQNNPYYDDRVTFPVEMPGGEVVEDHRSSWSLGYGPFGFNPTYYLPLWRVDDPPWVFCNDDGLAAIITAVWAARDAQEECRALGHGASYGTVNRRFSSGHCESRHARKTAFFARARSAGITPNSRAKLGKKWPKATSERDAIFAHMRKKAEEKQILSPHAQAGSTGDSGGGRSRSGP